MSETLFKILSALLIAGVVMPFFFQLVKVKALKNRLQGWASVILAFIVCAMLAAISLLIFSRFTLPALLPSTIIVWITAQSFYTGVIARFFPGRGATS